MILVGGIVRLSMKMEMFTKMKVINGTELTCVATLYKNVIYVISAPAEHQDVMDYIENLLNEKLDGSQKHGFLTDKDEFVTIEQGLQLAKTLGKIQYAKM